MDRKVIPSKKTTQSSSVDPDDIQERLVDRAVVRHDHGGHEHGHDWDDWLKADRALKSKGDRKKRVYSKPKDL